MLGRVSGQLQEDVVQRRSADGDVVDRDAGVVQPTDGIGNRPPALGDRDADGSVLEERAIAGDRGQRGHGLLPTLLVAKMDVEPLAADLALQLGGRPFRDHQALVDHGDAIGEPVGLVEVPAW